MEDMVQTIEHNEVDFFHLHAHPAPGYTLPLLVEEVFLAVPTTA